VRRWRGPLLWLAGFRVVLGVVAIPLAPFLYREHAVVLVLLRPTKDVLLLVGFLIRQHDVGLLPVLAAAVPLAVLGVWHFFFLGKAYSREIKRADLPGIAGKLLPPKRICTLADAVEEQGVKLVFLGRLAAFPSTMVAAAAGTAEMPSRRFLVADGIGAILSVLEVLGAGYLLGDAYDRAGPWITVLGLVVLAVMAVLLGRKLRGQGGTSTGMLRDIRRVRKEKGVRAAIDEARAQLSS
jgi:membrane protein DedA with SNARE-associated domain